VNTKLSESARRRESLISRAEAQREDLRNILHEMRKPFRLVGAGLALHPILKLTPAVGLGLTAFYLIFRPRRKPKRPQLIGIVGWLFLRLLRALGLGRRT
jgi:hypothetical protein